MIRTKKGQVSISTADYQQALHSLYRVWLVEPQGDMNQLVEYEMDQEALEEFFEDYTRFAELLVRIDPINPPAYAEARLIES